MFTFLKNLFRKEKWFEILYFDYDEGGMQRERIRARSSEEVYRLFEDANCRAIHVWELK